MLIKRLPTVLAFVSILAALPTGASAQDQAEQKPLSAGLLFGGGVSFGEGDLNAFGLGVGLRGGYTLESGLYAGGTFLYHNGDSARGVDFRMMQVGLELGYTIPTPIDVALRPYGGLGLNVAMTSGGPVDDSELSAQLDLGVTGLYPISDFFVGADTRLALIFGDDVTKGLVFTATGGVNF